jgi:Tfp pilus assembly protein PilX
MLKNKDISSFPSQSGQALLIVVLVMVIALTVGLSVISRTVTNLRTSTEQASSQKALAAAEAGIEQAIEKNTAGGALPIIGNFPSGATSYITQVTENSNVQSLLNGGNVVPKDQGVDVWLIPYSADPTSLWTTSWSGNLIVYWGTSSDVCTNDSSNTMAALEIVVVSGSKASPITTRYAYDPCTNGVNRQSSDNFTPVAPSSNTIAGDTFNYSVSVPVTQGFLARVVPLYAGSLIAVAGQDAGNNPLSLPAQGKTIVSTGKSDNGTTHRKVAVFESYPELPTELFPFTIFSP